MNIFSNHRLVTIDGQTLITLMEIAKHIKRLADAWEGDKPEPQEKMELTPAQRNVKSQNAKQQPWTPEEDNVLLELVDFFGPKWVTISKTKKLSGRTPSAIGSRYNNILKHRASKE